MKAIIAANVALFFITELVPGGRVLQSWLGLVPSATITQLRIWQPATYMFLHAGLFHLLFNMLALWMFGTELERIWGRRYFLKFYFVCGIGAGLLTVLFVAAAVHVLARAVRPRSSSAPPARSTACCSPTACTSRIGRS